METIQIDNGFQLISASDAKRLTSGTLPRDGYETLVEHDGKSCWLASMHWSIREAKHWKRNSSGAARLS